MENTRLQHRTIKACERLGPGDINVLFSCELKSENRLMQNDNPGRATIHKRINLKNL